MNKIHKQLLGIFLLIMLQSSLFGATYYVSTAGNDSSEGSIDKSWRTLSYAFSRLHAGDTLYIRGGTYHPTRTLMLSHNGAQGNPITVAGYPGETVIVDGQYSISSPYKHIIYLENKDYINLKDFTVKRSRYFGICSTGGSNIHHDHLTVTNTRASGIWMSQSKNSKITNCEITQCTEWGQDESISVYGSTHIEVAYNHVHHNGNTGVMDQYDPGWTGVQGEGHHNNGIGIDIKNGCDNVDVHHNYVHNMQNHSIYIDGRSGVNGDARNINIYNNKCHSTLVNLAVSNERGKEGDAVKDVKIYNNILYNHHTGVVFGWATERAGPQIFQNIQFINNVIYDSEANGIRWAGMSGSSDNIIANNIITHNGNYDIVDQVGGMHGLKVDNNILEKTNGHTGSNAILVDPNFVNPGSGDFRIASDSSALNAGSNKYYVPTIDYNGNVRPVGSTPTIGAFVYLSPTSNSDEPSSDNNIKEESSIFMISKDGLIRR